MDTLINLSNNNSLQNSSKKKSKKEKKEKKEVEKTAATKIKAEKTEFNKQLFLTIMDQHLGAKKQQYTENFDTKEAIDLFCKNYNEYITNFKNKITELKIELKENCIIIFSIFGKIYCKDKDKDKYEIFLNRRNNEDVLEKLNKNNIEDYIFILESNKIKPYNSSKYFNINNNKLVLSNNNISFNVSNNINIIDNNNKYMFVRNFKIMTRGSDTENLDINKPEIYFDTFISFCDNMEKFDEKLVDYYKKNEYNNQYIIDNYNYMFTFGYIN